MRLTSGLSGCLSDWIAAARERDQSRSFVHFATEGNEPNQGHVHGVLWDRRPTALSTVTASRTSSRDGFIEVLADVKPTSEGAFRVAVAWVNGLLQSGSLRHAPGVRLRRRGQLWTVRGIALATRSKGQPPRDRCHGTDRPLLATRAGE
jgi:hypothetical protein